MEPAKPAKGDTVSVFKECKVDLSYFAPVTGQNIILWPGKAACSDASAAYVHRRRCHNLEEHLLTSWWTAHPCFVCYWQGSANVVWAVGPCFVASQP